MMPDQGTLEDGGIGLAFLFIFLILAAGLAIDSITQRGKRKKNAASA